MSAHILPNETLPVNAESNCDLIVLDSHDPSFHYTIVPNALIRDETISPNCRWLIIYLISNRPGWSIKTSQLHNHTKGFIGRDKIRGILKEAIEAGYIKREDALFKRPEGGFLKRCTYTVASFPKFKKTLPRPENTGPGDPYAENQGHYSLPSDSLPYKEEEITPPTPSNANAAIAAGECVDEIPLPKEKKRRIIAKKETSQAAKDLMPRFIQVIKDFKPNFIVKKEENILASLDEMLSDGRKEEDILRVLRWGIRDNTIRGDWTGWSDKIICANPAEYLCNRFEKIEAASYAKKIRKFAPCSNDQEALDSMADFNARAI